MSIRQTVANGATVIGQITKIDKTADGQTGEVTIICQEKGKVILKVYLSELQSPNKVLEKGNWVTGRCKIRNGNTDLLRKYSYCPAPESLLV